KHAAARVVRMAPFMRRACLLAVVVALLASTAWAAEPEYVSLTRLATLLKARLEARPDSTQARLTMPGRVVVLTRNWSRITVNGSPLRLDAPVRVRNGVWLVPDTLAEQLSPRVVGVSTAAPSAAPAPAPGMRMPVALEELRSRSYPSFTRIVIETSGPLAYRVEASGTREARVRLLMLAGFPRVQEVADGFIAEARLERAGDDA